MSEFTVQRVGTGLAKATMLLLLVIGLALALPLTATAGGDQSRGDAGVGSVCQQFVHENPPFEPANPCPLP